MPAIKDGYNPISQFHHSTRILHKTSQKIVPAWILRLTALFVLLLFLVECSFDNAADISMYITASAVKFTFTQKQMYRTWESIPGHDSLDIQQGRSVSSRQTGLDSASRLNLKREGSGDVQRQVKKRG
jgi:hypothetical protein